MVTNLTISLFCLLLSILLFRNYNSGKGGPIGSLKKRLIYTLSLIAFIVFIVFLNRAYYYSDNQQNKQLINELEQTQVELDKLIDNHFYYSGSEIQENEIKIKRLLSKNYCDTISVNDTVQFFTLISDYLILADSIRERSDSILFAVKNKYSKMEKLILQLDSASSKEQDTYFDILINILSAFIAFVIGFTFRNRILG
jgi:hypothetical protein